MLATRGDSYRSNKRKAETDNRSLPTTNKDDYRAAGARPLAAGKNDDEIITPGWLTFKTEKDHF
jgi:hypothetical protein